jgi:hypothetical protein
MKSEKKIFYGGWWVKDWLCRRVVARVKCMAPDWSVYAANVNARRAA